MPFDSFREPCSIIIDVIDSFILPCPKDTTSSGRLRKGEVGDVTVKMLAKTPTPRAEISVPRREACIMEVRRDGNILEANVIGLETGVSTTSSWKPRSH